MDLRSRKIIRVRLARIEGQIRGLMRMLDDDRESKELLIQLAALRSALDSVGSLVISDHVEQIALSSGLAKDTSQDLRSLVEAFLK